MPPGGDKLVRRLLEESVLRLNERFKAENEKKMQTMEQIDIVAPQEENKCEVVNLADEDEDSVARLEAEEVIEVSDEENFIDLLHESPPEGRGGEQACIDDLVKSLVFNYVKVAVPVVSEDFERAFTFARTQLQLEEVVNTFNLSKEINDTAVDTQKATLQGDEKDGYVEDLVKGLVFNFLKESTPDLAKKFEEAFSFCHTQMQLEDVMEHFGMHIKGSLLCAERRVEQKLRPKPEKPVGKKNRSTGCRVRKFTQDEDEVIKEVMAKVGKVNPADCKALATRLDRGYRSIQARIESLQINSGTYRRKTFTFTEDCLILEALILPRLKIEKLSKILLSNCHFEKLAADLNRKLHSVRHRWEGNLQPTLLQYYAGTLNMQVEKILANFIADTFDHFSEINWPLVASRPEFAGHTEQSLKNMYFQELLSSTRKILGNQDDEVTPRQVAEHTREKNPAWRKNKEKQQQALIAFFEREVDQLDIKGFL